MNIYFKLGNENFIASFVYNYRGISYQGISYQEISVGLHLYITGDADTVGKLTSFLLSSGYAIYADNYFDEKFGAKAEILFSYKGCKIPFNRVIDRKKIYKVVAELLSNYYKLSRAQRKEIIWGAYYRLCK